MFLINNDWHNENDCPITPTDRGITLGDGVFDTMLIENGKTIHAQDHIERVLRHAGILKITNLPDTDEILERVHELINKNGAKQGRHALRTTITRGEGTRGLTPPENSRPLIIMRMSEITQSPPPAKAWISKTTRRNEHSPISRIKSTNYADNILALLEAKDNNSNEAILLNTKNNVTCASAGNIYIVENHKLYTPPLSDGVMDGVTRCKLIKTHDIKEETITEERLLNAEHIYISNAISIRPVITLNGIDKLSDQEQHLK